MLLLNGADPTVQPNFTLLSLSETQSTQGPIGRPQIPGCSHPTLLPVAVAQSDEQLTRMLLNCGANPDIRSKRAIFSFDPAERATEYHLLSSDITDGTALQVACCMGNLDIAKILLENDADPNPYRRCERCSF
jgi:hypothetical protein